MKPQGLQRSELLAGMKFIDDAVDSATVIFSVEAQGQVTDGIHRRDSKR